MHGAFTAHISKMGNAEVPYTVKDAQFTVK